MARAQFGFTPAPVPAPTGIQITVDYVTTSQTKFYKEAGRIASGKEHDALLLAALLKDGAQHTSGPQINTMDNVPGRVSEEQTGPVTITSFIQVSPHINKNGAITVTMTNHLETSSSDPPSPGMTFGFGANSALVDTTEVTETNTYQDGQTLMVGSVTMGSVANQAGSPAALFIFATVTSTAKTPAAPTTR